MDTPRTKIVDSVQANDQGSRMFALAAIISSVHPVAWYALIILIGGFLLSAVAVNYRHFGDFINGCLLWGSRGLIATGVILGIVAAYKMYQMYDSIHRSFYDRRTAKALAQKQEYAAEKARIENERLQIRLDIDRQLPAAMKYGMEHGFNIRYDGKVFEVLSPMSNLHTIAGNSPDQKQLGAPVDALPTRVLYEDIQHEVEPGQVIIGIGPNGVETKDEKLNGACVWIVGNSGTGKTSSAVVRVEERYNRKHKFMGYDPHWFKPDSLTNAVVGYSGSFLKPMARYPEEGLVVLEDFLARFNNRKYGREPKPWQPITLIVEEVNAIIDPTTPEEEEVAKLLPTIVRICGTESRNFEMGGIFLSQTATNLAWLRKVALLVIVHQMLMKSEIELAVGGYVTKEFVDDMKTWPRGRTYVFGINFGEVPHNVQQPYFEKPQGSLEWRFEEVPEQSQQEQKQPPLSLVKKDEPRRATINDAIEVWNTHPGTIGRPALMAALQERGLECTDDMAKKFIIEIKRQLAEDVG